MPQQDGDSLYIPEFAFLFEFVLDSHRKIHCLCVHFVQARLAG
jgi:hypothetical protein